MRYGAYAEFYAPIKKCLAYGMSLKMRKSPPVSGPLRYDKFTSGTNVFRYKAPCNL